ncbi:hypothetical protein ACET3Z_019914 [Daucus carota]
MSWADLPKDLLSVIFQDLANNNCHLPDLCQCLYVCSLWRRVAKELCQCSAARAAPWLLIPREQPDKLVFDTSLNNSHNKTSIVFYNSSSDIFSLGLPIGEDQSSFTDQKVIVYASEAGWLLLGLEFKSSSSNLEQPVFLYNPMLKVLIKLPPLPSRLKLGRYTQFAMSETSPRCIICLRIDMTLLAFCKPSEGQELLSSSWVLSEKPKSSKFYVVSMIFHKENFYTMDDDCALYVHPVITDFMNDSSRTRAWPWPLAQNRVALSTYKKNVHPRYFRLVESINGEVLMVERISEEKYRHTISFNVYKLTVRGSYKRKNCGSDKSNCYYYWKEVNKLEENEALYLGWNDSVSISVNVSDSNNINTYKPNCIYFFDEELDGELCSYGVFNLENNSIQHADLLDSDEYDTDTDTDTENEAAAGPKFCRLFTPSIPGYY